MTRVCSWCRCRLGGAKAAGGGLPTHGICPKCLVAVLEELETIARRRRQPPMTRWLIVVARDDVARFRELQRRFSKSRLVDVIRDRRTTQPPPGPDAGPRTERRRHVPSREDDRNSYGFFVVFRPGGRKSSTSSRSD